MFDYVFMIYYKFTLIENRLNTEHNLIYDTTNVKIVFDFDTTY